MSREEAVESRTVDTGPRRQSGPPRRRDWYTILIQVCRDDSPVFDRLGLDAGDRRNALVVVLVMSAIMLVFARGPLLVRTVVATVLGLTSGVTFLLVNRALDRVVG
jgi:hypothetical protein